MRGVRVRDTPEEIGGPRSRPEVTHERAHCLKTNGAAKVAAPWYRATVFLGLVTAALGGGQPDADETRAQQHQRRGLRHPYHYGGNPHHHVQ
jgi:hypothetical protein